MNQLGSVLIIVYEFGIFPVLLGLLWLGKKERAGFAVIYARGYFCMLALFGAAAVPMISAGKGLSALAPLWLAVTLAAAPAVLVSLLIRKKMVCEKFHELWENIKYIREKLSYLAAVFLVAALFSAAFVIPSETDDTAETAAIAIDTDAMYRFEAYTKAASDFTLEEKGTSPVEMLYAAAAVNSGLESTFLIHMALPFFLLPFFFAVNWEAAKCFCRNDMEKSARFVLFVMIFYSASCYTRTIPAMGAFQNLWNAAALFVCCGMPMVLASCFRLLDAAEKGGGISKKELLFLPVQFAACQVMLGRGAMLSALVLFLCAAMFVFRKLIRLFLRFKPLPWLIGAASAGMLFLCFWQEGIRSSWISYGADTVNIALLYLAVLWIFLYEKKSIENNLYLYTIFSVFLILGMQLLCILWLHREMMPKTYYLVPYALITSYVGVELSERLILRKNKWIIMGMYAIIIQAGIGLEYEDSYLFGNYNDRKISSTVMRMAECIEGIEGLSEPFLLAPEEISSQIQEYDVNIRAAYGAAYHYPEADLEQLFALMEEYGCSCLIVKKAYDREDYIKSKGYRQAIIFDGYSLYYKK